MAQLAMPIRRPLSKATIARFLAGADPRRCYAEAEHIRHASQVNAAARRETQVADYNEGLRLRAWRDN